MSCASSPEREFRSLLECSPDSISRYDLEGRILYFNNKLAGYLGVSTAEVIGKFPRDLWPDGRFDEIDRAIMRAMAGKSEEVVELDLPIVGGELLFSQIRVLPVLDDGRVVGALAFGRDISDLKRYEQSVLECDKLKEEISSMAAPLQGFLFTIRMDQRGRISFPFISEGVEDLFGLRPKEIQADADVLQERYHPEDLPRVLALMKETEKSLGPFKIEIRILHPEKGERWVGIRCTPPRQPDGATEWHGMMVDITERKHMEEEVAQAQAFLNSVINSIGDPVYVKDRQHRWILINQAQCNLVDHTVEEIIGKTDYDFFPEQEAWELWNAEEKVFTTGVENNREEELTMTDGSKRTLISRKSCFADANGQLILVGTSKDITQRKSIEQKLQLMSFALSNIQEEVLLVSLDGSIAYTNESSSRALGYNSEEYLRMRVFDIDPDITLDQWPDFLLKVKTQGTIIIESRHVRKDGTEYPVEVTINHFEFGGTDYILRVARDITDSNAAKATLAYERDLLQTLLTNSLDYIWFKDTQSRFIKSSTASARRFGASSPEELVGKSDFDFFSEEHARPAFEDEQEIIRTGQPIVGKVEKETWQDARKDSWCLTTKMPLRNKEGIIIGTFGISKDITAIKEAEDKLSHEQARFRFIFETMPVGVAMHRQYPDGRLDRITNDANLRLCGITREQERIPEIYDSIIHPEDLVRQRELARELEKGLRDQFSMEKRLIRLDGSQVWVAYSRQRRHYEDGSIEDLTTLVDITDLKQSEKALQRFNRNLRTLSACNETLIHAVSEAEILQSICRVIVELGEYRMAWVGCAEHDAEKTIRPVAWHGHEEGYLAKVNISWADTERGCGPAARCIRTGEIQVVEDFQKDPSVSLWKEDAIARGYYSCINLPLSGVAGLSGVLGIYAKEPGVFHEEEVKLLQELANDLSFGLATLHTRKALAENDERLQLEIERMPIGHISWDRDFRILSWNPEAEKIFGYSGAEVLGRKCDPIVPRETYDEFMNLFSSLSSRGESVHSINENITKDGRTILCEWTNTPLKRSDGTLLGAISTVRDVTAFKEAERQRKDHLLFLESMDRINRAIQGTLDFDQMLSDLLDEILDIFHCDRAWIVYPLDPKSPVWNVTMERTVPEYPGVSSMQQVDLPMDANIAAVFQHALRTELPCLFGPQYEHVVPPEIEENFQVKTFIAMALYPKGDKPYLFGLHQCSHIRTWSEHEVRLFQEIGRRLTEELTGHFIMRELHKSEKSLRQTLLLAQKANAAKSEFLANVSHEIRTPLNGVVGVTEMLSDTTLSLQQQELVQMIESSGKWLLNLVNDLLDLSKMEEGKIELIPADFNLNLLLIDLISVFELKGTEQGVQIICSMDPDVPMHLRGDASRLRQIIANLLSNAMKFTEAGSVSLGVSLKRQSGRGLLLRFSVRDTGIGIPADQQSTIFDSFTQVDSSLSRKHKGTGLGLAISKKLATLMGGEIGIVSEPGKGSEFWFTARFGRVEVGSSKLGAEGKESASSSDLGSLTSDPSPASNSQLPASNFRILLAEDNVINQRIALHFLKKLGFSHVDAVFNGQEAVQSLCDKDYDLVLMDVQMPVLDGFEATHQIRDPSSSVRNHNIPIVSMTAHAIGDYKVKCLESGMNGYISKPINMTALKESLEIWVHQKNQPPAETGSTGGNMQGVETQT